MHPDFDTFRRCSRALLGLVTVWCLGCSSYEPILGWLLGDEGAGAMACGTQPRVNSQEVAASVTSGTVHAAPTASIQGSDRGFDCGCGGSCHAPSPTLASLGAPASRVPAVEQAPPVPPASVSRTPLLPPPESLT